LAAREGWKETAGPAALRAAAAAVMGPRAQWAVRGREEPEEQEAPLDHPGFRAQPQT
jgi:hypothetical protein